jgi:hypothetical protein
MNTSLTLEPIPTDPVATKYRPGVCKAVSDLIAHTDIVGVGANVRENGITV